MESRSPQRGRYREFYQCDADIIGSKNIWNEVELTLLISDVFNDLGLEEHIIKVNHRDILFKLASYVGLNGKEVAFCAEVDKLEKTGMDSVKQKLQALGADSNRVELILNTISSTDNTTFDEIQENHRRIK